MTPKMGHFAEGDTWKEALCWQKHLEVNSLLKGTPKRGNFAVGDSWKVEL